MPVFNPHFCLVARCWQDFAVTVPVTAGDSGPRTGPLRALAWFGTSLTSLWAGTERRWICLPQAHHLVWQLCCGMCAFVSYELCGEGLMRTNWHGSPGVLNTLWEEVLLFFYPHMLQLLVNFSFVTLEYTQINCWCELNINYSNMKKVVCTNTFTVSWSLITSSILNVS